VGKEILSNLLLICRNSFEGFRPGRWIVRILCERPVQAGIAGILSPKGAILILVKEPDRAGQWGESGGRDSFEDLGDGL